MHRSESLVVVTGAGGRLGRIMARAFARRGVRVAAIGHKPLPPDDHMEIFTADLTTETDTTRVFEEIKDRCGPLHGLIHTVGMWTSAPLAEMSLTKWERVVRINLTSTFLCFREAARHMSPEGGALVAFSSAQGADRGVPEQAAYAAAKAGIIRLVESTAQELKSGGITAYAIAPSYILYGEEEEGRGVPVSDLVDLTFYLMGSAGGSLSGATLRAYGMLF